MKKGNKPLTKKQKEYLKLRGKNLTRDFEEENIPLETISVVMRKDEGVADFLIRCLSMSRLIQNKRV